MANTILNSANWTLVINKKFLPHNEWGYLTVSAAPKVEHYENGPTALVSIPRNIVHRTCTLGNILKGSETYKMLLDFSKQGNVRYSIEASSRMNSIALNTDDAIEYLSGTIFLVQQPELETDFFSVEANQRQSLAKFDLEIIVSENSTL